MLLLCSRLQPRFSGVKGFIRILHATTAAPTGGVALTKLRRLLIVNQGKSVKQEGKRVWLYFGGMSCPASRGIRPLPGDIHFCGVSRCSVHRVDNRCGFAGLQLALVFAIGFSRWSSGRRCSPSRAGFSRASRPEDSSELCHANTAAPTGCNTKCSGS